MSTLMAVYDADGCTGRCDARCYEATGGVCTCCCGGVNHGVGRRRAEEQTAELGLSLLARWQAEHPETVHSEWSGQLPLLPV